jgi:hypothetical protein
MHHAATNYYPIKLRLKVKFFWSDKNGVVGSKLSFKKMSVIPQTPELPGGFGIVLSNEKIIM